MRSPSWLNKAPVGIGVASVAMVGDGSEDLLFGEGGGLSSSEVVSESAF